MKFSWEAIRVVFHTCTELHLQSESFQLSFLNAPLDSLSQRSLSTFMQSNAVKVVMDPETEIDEVA